MPENAVPDVPIPPKLKQRPFDARGFLIPWFVAYTHEAACATRRSIKPGPICDCSPTPDFRTMDANKFRQAITERRCWTCGGVLGVHKVFVLGPMCAINRTSPEPPSHRECALYSMMACPFLSKPHAQRRIAGIPEGAVEAAGLGLARNPKVTMLWTTPEYTVFSAGAGTRGYLIRLGRPTEIEFYRERRRATIEEIRESVQTGLPHLEAMAALEGANAVVAFGVAIKEAARYFPAGVL